mgnify:CR=1 FL=1
MSKYEKYLEMLSEENIVIDPYSGEDRSKILDICKKRNIKTI